MLVVFVLFFIISLSSSSELRCDFEVLSSGSIKMSDLKQPVIIRDALTKWPLHIDFMDKYGDLKTSVGSESSIVYSHGSADTQFHLKNLTDQSCHSESLSFDLDILKKNPQLLETYKMPTILEPIFGSDLASPVLSVGFVHSGLPLHTHGEAFLGLISGHKQWLLYPPGSAPPAELQKEWNPFLPMQTWLTRLEALLDAEDDRTHPLSPPPPPRPQICVQQPGEVVFVPAGWAHSTYNIAPPPPSPPSPSPSCTPSATPGTQRDPKHEVASTDVPQLPPPTPPPTATAPTVERSLSLPPTVIGIGMQNTWLAAERERFSREVLQLHPLDYEALKGVATSIFHKAFPAPGPVPTTTARGGPDVYTPAELTTALDEAIACLKQAIEIRPNYPEVRNLLVVILFRRGEGDRAEALAEVKALERLLDRFAQDSSNRSNSSNSCSRGRAALWETHATPVPTSCSDAECACQGDAGEHPASVPVSGHSSSHISAHSTADDATCTCTEKGSQTSPHLTTKSSASSSASATASASASASSSQSSASAAAPVSESSARGLASTFFRLSLPLSAKVRLLRHLTASVPPSLCCFLWRMSFYLPCGDVLGLVEDALRLLQKSLDLDKSNPKAHAQRILLLQKSEQYAAALLALQEMEAVTPQEAREGEGESEGEGGRARHMLVHMKAYLLKKVNNASRPLPPPS